MKYNYNIDAFKVKENNFYYLLGVFLTDGNIFKSKRANKIQLTSKDEDWLKILQNYLQCALYKTKDGHHNLVINNKEICQILIDNGCLPNKSLITTVPENIPSLYIPDFLRGCIDGDGSIPQLTIRNQKKQCFLYSSSLKFLQGIKEMLNLYNIKSNIYEIEKKSYVLKNNKTINPHHKHYRLTVTGKSVNKMLSLIYCADGELSMPRKQNIAKLIMQS